MNPTILKTRQQVLHTLRTAAQDTSKMRKAWKPATERPSTLPDDVYERAVQEGGTTFRNVLRRLRMARNNEKLVVKPSEYLKKTSDRHDLETSKNINKIIPTKHK